MRRKLTTLRAKQGHTNNGADRTLIDLAMYNEMQQVRLYIAGAGVSHWDSEYSGLSNASRPRDQAISLRQARTLPRRGGG
jgi:hypothetical protein